MVLNDLILLVTGLLSAGLVFVAWKFDKERLYSVIVIFLILISITGGKIVEFFGHETNTGNIFYASVFLATYFLIERYGKREGIRSIGISLISIVFFLVLLQLTVALVGSTSTQALNAALSMTFMPAIRITIASLCAYTLAQGLNIFLFIYLKKRFEYRWLWIRANISNVLAQILDSVVFFTIAFWGVTPPANMLDIILTGLVIKVVFIMLTSPLLYLNRIEEDGNGQTVLTLR